MSDVPEFDTQLSLVSIVGDRGVGKSTVASLLSGNSSMFVVGKSFREKRVSAFTLPPPPSRSSSVFKAFYCQGSCQLLTCLCRFLTIANEVPC